MADVVITIVRRPDGKIEPQGGSPTRVPAGKTLEFAPGPGATSVDVFFEVDSPFGDAADDKKIPHGHSRPARAFRNGGNNRFAYRCELVINGKREGWPKKAGEGGEIEITPF